MIDFIKCFKLPVGVEDLLKHPLLSFPCYHDMETGEIEQERKLYCNYNNMTFTVKPISTMRRLQGSLHKFWNHGDHNFNDFNFYSLVKVIDTLWDQFGINPFATTVNLLEVGVNVSVPIPTGLILESLISHRGVLFTKMDINGSEGKTCNHRQYTIKVYNKSKQFGKLGCPPNLIRIELKVNKMEYFKSQGISVGLLSDLMDREVLYALGRLLIKVVGEILYCDPTLNLEALTATEHELIGIVTNPNTWERAKPKNTAQMSADTQMTTLSRYKFNNTITRYRELFDRCDQLGVQDLLTKHISRKWESLLWCKPMFVLKEIVYSQDFSVTPMLQDRMIDTIIPSVGCGARFRMIDAIHPEDDATSLIDVIRCDGLLHLTA